ncbi:MAG: LamG domain-containing protein [Candidatus Poribacteria bacterium]|nr:LamG domain-containing protein [Candidatus Poribacteria bacterium]
MKILYIGIALLLCFGVTSWALEEDDPAIVGVWLFEGDVKDATANGNDGKIVGNFKFEDGKFGKAVVAGGGGSIDVSDSKSLQSISDELTVAAWFRVDADSDTGVRKNGAYLLEDQSGGEPIPDGFSFRVWTGAGITPGFYGKTELEQGKWYHVAGTYDGKNVEMYVDGEPESKKGALSSNKADWKPEWNGKVNPGETLQLKFGPEQFTGGIDEIVLLSRALEADEIQQLLNGWDEAFAVEPEGKLATTWARVKTAR